MGTDFQALHTETPTDFITALFVGNHSFVIASENNFSPETNFGRLYFTFTGTAGLVVTTLALTYILHVYTALQERDSLGLELHILTGETNDAAELLAGLGAHGHLHTSYTELGNAATQHVAADEATAWQKLILKAATLARQTRGPRLPGAFTQTLGMWACPGVSRGLAK